VNDYLMEYTKKIQKRIYSVFRKNENNKKNIFSKDINI
jgi:hypothetical protein